MEVLRFIPLSGDYELVLRATDVGRQWTRFVARFGLEAARRYCRYTSSVPGRLTLCPPGGEGDVGGFESEVAAGEVCREWDGLWPVVYETVEYNLSVRFRLGVLDAGTVPEVLHVRKDVAEKFFVDRGYGSGGRQAVVGLSGALNFCNEPGRFLFELRYSTRGMLHRVGLQWDVVSVKLDMRGDLRCMLSDIERTYSGLVFRYLSTTYQELRQGHVHGDVVWLRAFETAVEDYLDGVRIVIASPRCQARLTTEYDSAERIHRWPSRLEEEYGELRSRVGIGPELERHMFRHELPVLSRDNRDNRFVLYTLRSVGRRLGGIVERLTSQADGLSEQRLRQLTTWREELDRLARHPFFNGVGQWHNDGSVGLVLQSRRGYQQVYRSWLRLREGVDFYSGSAAIGIRPVSEIYEVWCYLQVVGLVAKLLGAAASEVRHAGVPLLTSLTGGEGEHIVEVHYPTPPSDDESEWAAAMRRHRGEWVTVHYQHTYPTGSADTHGVGSATTEQRPDIVVNLHSPDHDTPLLTYLYDAKYRVATSEGGSDDPPVDAINQMHRYRDAILYQDSRGRSKEVVGGYILYPGRGLENAYSQAVGQVNIGAFALLPGALEKKEIRNKSKEEGDDVGVTGTLEAHLRGLLLERRDYLAHVSNALPQRGLYYTDRSEYDLHSLSLGLRVVVVVDIRPQYYAPSWHCTTFALELPQDAAAFETVARFSQAQALLLTDKRHYRYFAFSTPPTVASRLEPTEGTASRHITRLPKVTLFAEGAQLGRGTFFLLFHLAEGTRTPDIDVGKVVATSGGGAESYLARCVELGEIVRSR